MPALDKQKRYAEEAAAAYKVFKARIETEKTLTREEKIARLEMFLDSHVSIFDEYYEEAVRNGGIPNANKLSDDASLMAKESMGFPSTDKLFSFIMWRFATALYSAAFLKNGQVVTQHDKDTMSSLERNERRMFTNLIKSMGMRVIYPQNPGDKPVPDANAIYKTLMK